MPLNERTVPPPPQAPAPQEDPPTDGSPWGTLAIMCASSYHGPVQTVKVRRRRRAVVACWPSELEVGHENILAERGRGLRLHANTSVASTVLALVLCLGGIPTELDGQVEAARRAGATPPQTTAVSGAPLPSPEDFGLRPGRPRALFPTPFGL